jgi:hypothetical protein
MIEDSLDTLPGCFANYPKAIAPNICRKCKVETICKRVTQNFIAKKNLHAIVEKIDNILTIIRG